MNQEHYMIWSIEHQAWWKPQSIGYTTSVWGAGLYSPEEANKITRLQDNGRILYVSIPAQSANPLPTCPGCPHPEDKADPEAEIELDVENRKMEAAPPPPPNRETSAPG